MDRRHFFQSTSLVTTGALVGCALPGVAQQQVKTPFAVPAITLPIVGSDEVFPVRRIYCIGRNYRAHSIEMGSNPDREPPFFFQKPTDAIQYVKTGTVADHPYPTLTKNYHYEAELVAALGKGGRNIPVAQALDYVYGYSLGLDMTRRDLQRAMGDEKKPWEIGKSFDKSAPIGAIHKLAQTGHFKQGDIWLKVNGQTKQKANLSQMIWSVAEQIAKLSEAFELFPGDIIYSGTPENVGPVVRGDVIEMHIDGLPNLSVKIV
jgi:2-keto-4-pentenoate hydratase/2-oxohepta-3-ene-1,7-dioic acid hydratase in catechol pathway